MAGGEGPSTRRRDTEERISIEEQIEGFGPVPMITLTMPGSSQASERSGSSSTIKASRVNPLKKVDEGSNVDEHARPPEISSSTEADRATFKPKPNFTKSDSSLDGGLWIKKTNGKKGVKRESGKWEMGDTD